MYPKKRNLTLGDVSPIPQDVAGK